MHKHFKKVVVSTVIIVFIIGYYLFIGYILSSLVLSFWLKIIALLIPIVFVALSIYTLVVRIKEIRRGEEDDLSKY